MNPIFIDCTPRNPDFFTLIRARQRCPSRTATSGQYPPPECRAGFDRSAALEIHSDRIFGRDFEAGPTEVGVILKVFNIFGDEGHDWWQTLNVPPGDSYVPSGYIWPRRAMVQLRLRF